MTAAAHEIDQAARILESGGLVAFPTETVYGLGADAENPEAVARIYAAKGRPSNHPVIVHLAPEADISYWAADIPEEARQLIKVFWPGPLTLILRRASHIPDAVSGGQDTIGLRCPSHPVAQALLKEFKQGKGGVAAPSANKFGHVSPTTAEHVRDEFGAASNADVACILDGGQSDVGIESTIVDLSRVATHGPVLLRPGHISVEQISQVIGRPPLQAPDATAPRASGTLDAHYAPRTPLALVASNQLQNILTGLLRKGRRVALISMTGSSLPGPMANKCMPMDEPGYAHELYAALRVMDSEGVDVIVVEIPPQDASWQGVNDRLRRAAFDSTGILDKLLK